MWSKIVQLKVIKDDPGLLYFKYSYDSDYKKYKFKITNTRHVDRKEQQRDKSISLKKESDQQ